MSKTKSNPDEGVIPEEGLHPDVEMGSASQEGKPSYEGLLEEVKALKGTVEGLKQSLEKKDKKIVKQGKVIKDMRGMFSKSKWTILTQQHEMRKVSLAESLRLEESLIKTMEGLKDCMARAGRQIREKEEEVRKLGKKVERLRMRAEQRKLVDLKEAPEEGDVKAKVATLTQRGHGARDGRRAAVAILPEEVWKLIFGNLCDPKDLWNCCNTCQLFENLLRPWKTGWMLEQALPHLYRHLSGSKLLECRQVSKGWYAGVNSFLDNHPSTQPHRADRDPRRIDFVYPVKEKEIGNRNVFNFGPGEDLSVLERLFPKTLSRNPFLGRYVIFHLRKPDYLEDTPEVEEQRWAKMYDFLEAYGNEIWNLSLYFPWRSGPLVLEKITELMTSKLFQLVPNLRKLFIGNTASPMGIIDPEELPPAPNFNTLQFHPISDGGIVEALINKYHPQLEVLQLDAESAWNRNLVNDLEWPNLKELFLYLGVGDDGWSIDLGTLFELRMPQLSKLILSFEDIRRLNFRRLVKAINELTVTASLSSFGLVGPFEDIDDEELATDVFVMEGVKTLELIDPWHRSSIWIPTYNFLRYFPFIENLVIMVRNTSDYKYDNEVDLMPDGECKRRAARLKWENEFVEVHKYAYVGQMYKSNIWELLPRLKVFTFQWDVYTRENYEAYAKQRPTNCEREAGGSME